MARSGVAAARALERRGAPVVRDDRDADGARREDEPGLLDGADALVKSPGISGDNALVVAARAAGVPVWSEIELAYRLLEGARIVAVTGTNGKTTTSELLGVMLGAPVAGNVGRALTKLDGRIDPGGLVVCELSSFQ